MTFASCSASAGHRPFTRSVASGSQSARSSSRILMDFLRLRPLWGLGERDLLVVRVFVTLREHDFHFVCRSTSSALARAGRKGHAYPCRGRAGHQSVLLSGTSKMGIDASGGFPAQGLTLSSNAVW